MINRQWLLAARPDGMIGPQNFEYAETPIPAITSGQILVKNCICLSTPPSEIGWLIAPVIYRRLL